jgi:hypothetical protein
LLFHLSPHLINLGSSIIIEKSQNKAASITIEGYELSNSEYEYSSEYGKKTKAKCLTVSIPASDETKIINTYISKS